MNQKVEAQLQHIDTKLDRLLTNLAQHPAEKLQQRPTPGTWSVTDVLQHLMLVENASQQYVQKKLSFNPTLPNVNLGTAWRMLVLKSYNWLPIKLKAPKYVDETNFSTDLLLTDIADRWRNQRLQLRGFLESLPEDIFNKEVYKHPLAGRLSLLAMLQFYEGHFDRHHKQIRKLLKV
jgi:hypothetical protein